jgi:HD-like signal output (HDOD) protein
MDLAPDKALKGVTVPPCPAILTQLMDELKETPVNSKKIGILISQDVGIAAVVIRAANAPLVSSGHRIESISDAIRLLGFGSLANLVQEALLQNTITTTDTSLERFWDSSRYTALAASKLAAVVGHINPDTAYTFGLFHDCGIPLLVKRYPEYKKVLGLANKNTVRMFTQIEEDAIGTSHAVLGYYLARSWGLSNAVSQGILDHHDYAQLEDPRNLNSESHRLIAINAVAEYIAGTHLRSVQESEWRKARDGAALVLGYSTSDLDDIADDLVYQFDQDLSQQKTEAGK